MTKYIEIAEDLTQAILQRKYGHKLPKEAELAKQYQTSRVVISKALKLLTMKNLVRVVPGSGIYLKNKNTRMPQLSNLHDGFYHSMAGKGKIQSHVISFDIRLPEPEEAEKLKLKESDQVYDIIRQRLINGQPEKLEYTIMPVKVIPGLTKEILHDSIYSYIQEKLGLKIGKANRVITADKVDAYDIEYLNCQPGDAVLSVHQLAYLKDGRPFELSETRDRYDKSGYILFEVEN
ncbi:transcriptional regulator [Lactobacillus pasteurii DSM 23907 = CRBIP 24.76]|uniref:Transcriptional regulator n=1 Tax=Lactobacillus pasteurii DSM 23907 = CRBIP 24.76 TaxID=1423790 RepID=I7KKT8_9LACO|nr:GntR family transcriptional regulator [Lactobacillus pasteurii]KRK07501.1 transcriptional regulator [Lactobacillus pasteurii DSM 23907 = CRBIP 24.76]TDG77050.1 hypothetical protein C5L33_000693 [Lactobacillus pasteurii]CCI84794.1 Transcriptional regulator [Lactobacillus pasteurii DSM 23907 = CRBIP 24.76]